MNVPLAKHPVKMLNSKFVYSQTNNWLISTLHKPRFAKTFKCWIFYPYYFWIIPIVLLIQGKGVKINTQKKRGKKIQLMHTTSQLEKIQEHNFKLLDIVS